MKKKEISQKIMGIYMRNKKGFSLLSFLLYLMLFSLMTGFLCHIIVSLIIPSLTSVRKCQSVMALHIASDLFVRDVHAGIHNWKLITPHELIWQTSDGDIGWFFADNYLKRNAGLYNKGWKNKTTSIVAAGIAQATFVTEKAQDRIVGVELTFVPIVTQKKPIVCYVAVKPEEKI
jgi:hypothetical protein